MEHVSGVGACGRGWLRLLITISPMADCRAARNLSATDALRMCWRVTNKGESRCGKANELRRSTSARKVVVWWGALSTEGFGSPVPFSGPLIQR